MNSALRNIAHRINAAEDRFIDFAISHGGLTHDEAVRVLALYRKIKAVKIDAIGGQFMLTHGDFGNVDVLQKAAKQ